MEHSDSDAELDAESLLELFPASENESREEKADRKPPARPNDLARSVVIELDDVRIVVPPLRFDGAQSAISARIWRGSLLAASWLAEHRELARNKDILELGCGRALAGIAAAQLGSKRVILTDCDDRALGALVSEKTALPKNVEVVHFLWEADMAENRGSCVHHWSDAHRIDSIPELDPESPFDLVIAAECLYTPPQELSLAAVLEKRIAKPDGVALLVCQQRANASSQFSQARLSENLSKIGLELRTVDKKFDFEALLDRHVRCVPGQEDMQFCGSLEEDAPPRLTLVTWRRS